MINTTIPKYYSEIINYEYNNNDIFSYKLIEWYKEIVFLNINKLEDIDSSIYLFINDKNFNKELRNIVNIKKINIKNIDLINIIISFKNNYINNLKAEVTRWL